MDILRYIFDFILNIDVHLGEIISKFGLMTNVILFIIIFIETGLVVTPFLPGDSLLFAAGAFASLGSLNLFYLLLVLSLAAILGDSVNYWIGHVFGEKLIANPRIPIKAEYIQKTNAFFAKHGGKTIFIARFVPIIRTFAPFVAGIGKMHYQKFISYNVLGGVIWVFLFVLAGYFFGNVPAVKHNFSLVIIVIIFLSLLPALSHFIKSPKQS
jgi:membrane-associated protein